MDRHTEQTKMMSGELYFPSDEALSAQRLKARVLLYQLHQLPPSESKQRETLFKALFGRSDTFSIQLPFQCDYGYNIEIGENFDANFNCTMLDCAKITIGKNVLFAPNVSLFTAAHPIDPEKRNTGIEYALPITIGDNVWIGGNTVVLPNVTIGNNVVIGAGSVVTKDIPDDCIAVGNPCRVLRPLNEKDKIYYFKERKFE